MQLKDELEQATSRLGRELSGLELAVLESFWREHFSLKSSTQSLHLLKNAIPDFNPDVCRVEEGVGVSEVVSLAIAIDTLNPADRKISCADESTIVGTVTRTLASKGFIPFLLANSFRLKIPSEPKHFDLLTAPISRTAGYGNTLGIPTLCGELQFDDSYYGSGVLNVACVGVRQSTDVKRITPAKGDIVVLMLAGAWRKRSSSKSGVEENSVLDALATRSLLDGLELMNRQGIATTSESVGCGGLASAIGTMTVRHKIGITIRAEGLSGIFAGNWEQAFHSPSEPGIVLIIRQESHDTALEIADLAEVELHVVGEVTGDEFYTVVEGDEEKARIPFSVLTECCPALDRIEAELPVQNISLEWVEEPDDFLPIIRAIIGSPNICSRSVIYSQFDQHVGVRTALDIGENAGVFEGPHNQIFAVASDCNSYWCLLDPLHGAANSACESLRNVVSVGAKPILIGSALNFGNPERIESYAQYAESVRGIGQFCHDFEVPIGDLALSMFNEEEIGGRLERINPTPQIFMVGSFAHGVRPVRRTLCTPLANIFLLGNTHGDLNCTEFQRVQMGKVEGLPPRYRPEDEKNAMKAILEAHSRRLIRACNNVGRGGIAVALLKMAVNSSYGFKVEFLDLPGTARSLTQVLFSETSARYLAEVTESNQDEFLGIMEKNKVPHDELGLTVTEPIARFGKFSIPVSEVTDIFENGLRAFGS
ncbi:MAG: hypothetical protein JSW61_04455 [Candidatus Thorarchaeota archaeon]|nr:MAG: hypothetical protein JSW61_04455 [Candidatus Thorarchaeota archaeon]